MEHQFRKNELLRIRDVDSSTSVSRVSIQLLEGGGYQFDVTLTVRPFLRWFSRNGAKPYIQR